MLFQFIYFSRLTHRMPLIPDAARSKNQWMCFIYRFALIDIIKRMYLRFLRRSIKFFILK